MNLQVENKLIELPEEIILSKILFIRGLKVMIDRDLAELYGVTTKRLNEQVKRNLQRFPVDFMFQLSIKEKEEVVTICDHLQKLKYSPYLPYAFTEHGEVMLASVLNNERAIRVNVQIVRIYLKLREIMLSNKDVLLEFEKIKQQVSNHDEKILSILEYLARLNNRTQQESRDSPVKRIGFRTE